LAWCGRISNRGTRPFFLGGVLVVPVSDDAMIHIDLPRQARDKQTTRTTHKKRFKNNLLNIKGPLWWWWHGRVARHSRRL
jgi:hypothetical protein